MHGRLRYMHGRLRIASDQKYHNYCVNMVACVYKFCESDHAFIASDHAFTASDIYKTIRKYIKV